MFQRLAIDRHTRQPLVGLAAFFMVHVALGVFVFVAHTAPGGLVFIQPAYYFYAALLLLIAVNGPYVWRLWRTYSAPVGENEDPGSASEARG